MKNIALEPLFVLLAHALTALITKKKDLEISTTLVGRHARLRINLFTFEHTLSNNHELLAQTGSFKQRLALFPNSAKPFGIDWGLRPLLS